MPAQGEHDNVLFLGSALIEITIVIARNEMTKQSHILKRLPQSPQINLSLLRNDNLLEGMIAKKFKIP